MPENRAKKGKEGKKARGRGVEERLNITMSTSELEREKIGELEENKQKYFDRSCKSDNLNLQEKKKIGVMEN